MIKDFPVDAVALPGLGALALGFLSFIVALVAARSRAAETKRTTDTASLPASWLWIIVQGLAIGAVGFGRIVVQLAALSAKGLVEGFAVLAVMLTAVALFDASSRAMGKNWALVARTRSDHTLVQSGPFAWVRHPIYIALFLFMIAMAIAYGHTRNLIVAVPLYAVATWMRVRCEEQLLRAQFGADYDAYARRVKRFIPGVF